MIKTQEALAMVGGHVNEELLLRNEYLATENEILRSKLQSKISFSNIRDISQRLQNRWMGRISSNQRLK